MTRIHGAGTSAPVLYSPPQEENFYVVKQGDTLGNIAKENGLSLKQLLDANPAIKNPDRISIGQKINLKPEEKPAEIITVPNNSKSTAASGAEARSIMGLGAELMMRSLHSAYDKAVGAEKAIQSWFHAKNPVINGEKEKVDQWIAESKDLNGDSLTDRVFYDRHEDLKALFEKNPELQKSTMKKGSPLSEEWLQIKKEVVQPQILEQTKKEIPELDKDCETIPGYKDNPNVTEDFKAKVIEISKGLKTEPKVLMAIMAFESGKTFSPSVKNAEGSGATGLIQFMPETAKNLGTTTEKLEKMAVSEQLDYVQKYFEDYKGKLNSTSDAYMAVLWPKAVGQADDYILFSDGSNAYKQNKGLDRDGDGNITKEEASRDVRKFLGEH